MAVYEHNYKPYDGALTSERNRLLVIPRYAYRTLFANKLFIALYIFCFVCPLIYSILIYLRHNSAALTIFNITAGDLLSINNTFFYFFLNVQTILSFILTVIVGPGLISRDLANNAIPLYLSRPFSKVEYVVGKMSIMFVLLSLITWIPGELLFFLQAYLEGGGWMKENFFIANGIFILSVLYITMLSLLSMAFSALIKWKTASSAAMFGIMLVTAPIAAIIWDMFDTSAGFMLSIPAAFAALSGHLLKLEWMQGDNLLSISQSLASFIAYAVISLIIISRKIRAYEVVS